MIKKILMIIPSNTSGGAERVMIQLVNYFSENGIETKFLNFDRDSNFYPINENVEYNKLKLTFNSKKKLGKIIEAPLLELRRFVKIRKIIKEFSPDLVIPFLEMAEILTIPNCISLRVPFCVSIRNDYEKYPNYMKIFIKKYYPKAKLVVCQTEQVEQSLLESVSCKTTVIFNPLDPESYKSHTFIGTRRNVIINVGRLVSQKNQALLIKAYSKVANEFPNFELHIFGEGDLKVELEQLIKDLGLENKVYLKGTVSNVISHNYDVSLFVMSSDYEGFPNTLVEAMANGIPVISTNFNTGAAKYLFKDETCGYLVNVNDIEDMADKLKSVLKNYDEALIKSKKALYVKELLDKSNICDEWLTKISHAMVEDAK